MSTRSNIGILEPDGTVEMIYCHFDGYLEHNGKILLENHNSEESARSLVALGDLSSLCERIVPNEREPHSYYKPVKDVTIAYHRDRGEDWEDVEPSHCSSVAEAIENMEEYLYLWNVKKGHWMFTTGQFNPIQLTEEAYED